MATSDPCPPGPRPQAHPRAAAWTSLSRFSHLPLSLLLTQPVSPAHLNPSHFSSHANGMADSQPEGLAMGRVPAFPIVL